MVTVGVSVFNLIITQQKISSVNAKSLQAYFAADSGIEDAIYRIREGLSIQSNYSFQLAGIPVDVNLSESIGGSRTITSQATKSGVVKKIGAVHTFDADKVEFFFGAQVGEGGLEMSNGSKVIGNVASIGSIFGNGEITGSVSISGNSKWLNNINVGVDVRTYNCRDANITGDLYYVAGGTVDDCSAANIYELPEPIAPSSLPVSEEQIAGWKDEALLGGVYNGEYIIEDTASLGPLKIDGNLLVKNNAVLTLQGTLWVTGEFKVSNSGIVRLDGNVYGSGSGVVIVSPDIGAGDRVEIENGAKIQGTGQPGSYLMVLSTTSLDPAILIKNNVEDGIFYSSNGIIEVENNAVVTGVTGYGLRLNNNAVIEYEIGMEDLFFSAGPGGGWTVDSWREVN
jgi:hypothetical protein